MSGIEAGDPRAGLGYVRGMSRPGLSLGLSLGLALGLASACLGGCDSSATKAPEASGPTSTTQFRISVMNACETDVLIKLAEGPQAAGREQLLLRTQRDTISGTTEQVYLMRGSEVLASYRPTQGTQKLTVTSDCTALTPG